MIKVIAIPLLLHILVHPNHAGEQTVVFSKIPGIEQLMEYHN